MNGNFQKVLIFGVWVCFAFAGGGNDKGLQGNSEDHRENKENFLSLPAKWILRNKGVVTAGVIVFLFVVAGVFCVFSFVRRRFIPEMKEDEEKVFLIGRKLALPSTSFFRNGEKFKLSEDFKKNFKEDKEPKDIYKETLIRKLDLSKI